MTDQELFSCAYPNIGAVVIGRNEGGRLKQCLNSLVNKLEFIVYVDSGSTDQSVALAQSLGVIVVSLNMTQPFTAARARNAGLAKLVEISPNIDYVQFVDGDCEVRPVWFSQAKDFLDSHTDFAAVCGRRRERYPDVSIYNLLCDIEWDTPIGETKACGGDVLFRLTALSAVEGYRESLIAGEEPEMCYRMHQLGWKIMRLDAEMTLHDAAMTRFGQWWKRNVRAGHAYAESYALHGHEPEKFRKKETRSIVIWAVLIPLIIILLTIIEDDFISLWLIYPFQILRLAFQYKSKLDSFYLGLIYATSNVVGKWPQFMGIAAFLKNYADGKQGNLIEYK
ncbi:glycosyltransferase family 2 protein [Methylophaga sp.]|uniref:glycosyltransferase family 2 protein n=1 Tax=Methylophaga sp. TaxID=2024840 RepID=UPI003F6E4C55